MNKSNVSEDRILIETRVVAGLVILVLLLAFVALYVNPEFTDTNFAWTITPPTTAVLMGAGYIAGAYFFLRVLTGRKWHHVQGGYLPITAFTIFMLASTLLHLGRFHFGTLQFFLWTSIYIVTPFLVPFLLWRNHKTDPGTLEDNDFEFSRTLRGALGIFGLVVAVVMVIFFLAPSVMISIAPWKLTELTARVGAGWGVLAALTIVSIARDGRWSSARVLIESAIIAPVLMLMALPRIAGDFDWSNPITWAFVVGLAGSLIFLIAVRLLYSRPRQIPQQAT